MPSRPHRAEMLAELTATILATLTYAQSRQRESVLLHNSEHYGGAIILSTSCLELCGRASILRKAFRSDGNMPSLTGLKHKALIFEALWGNHRIPDDLSPRGMLVNALAMAPDSQERKSAMDAYAQALATVPVEQSTRIQRTREAAQYPNPKILRGENLITQDSSAETIAQSGHTLQMFIEYKLRTCLDTAGSHKSELARLADTSGFFTAQMPGLYPPTGTI